MRCLYSSWLSEWVYIVWPAVYLISFSCREVFTTRRSRLMMIRFLSSRRRFYCLTINSIGLTYSKCKKNSTDLYVDLTHVFLFVFCRCLANIIVVESSISTIYFTLPSSFTFILKLLNYKQQHRPGKLSLIGISMTVITRKCLWKSPRCRQKVARSVVAAVTLPCVSVCRVDGETLTSIFPVAMTTLSCSTLSLLRLSCMQCIYYKLILCLRGATPLLL